MPKRRSIEVFSLSFLDCICCGFGAVILFYVIISARSGITNAAQSQDLTSEVSRLRAEVLTGRQNLITLRNSLENTQSQTVSADSRIRTLAAELEVTRREMSAYNATSLARRERIEQLKADVKSMESGTRRLEAGSLDKGPPGQDVSAFRGTGDRRYITGIKVRGKHILILLDHSASMLHEDLVTIIRMRNLNDDQKRAAAKWAQGHRHGRLVADPVATRQPVPDLRIQYAGGPPSFPLPAENG
ncbi:MAG: hypothetical protein WDO56_20790 [Gammaproteobacteria bacterium]